jgi:hypothetical protein
LPSKAKRGLLFIASLFSIISQLLFPPCLHAFNEAAKKKKKKSQLEEFAIGFLNDEQNLNISSSIFETAEKFKQALFLSVIHSQDKLLQYGTFCSVLLNSNPWKNFTRNALQSLFFGKLVKGEMQQSASLYMYYPQKSLSRVDQREKNQLISSLPIPYLEKVNIFWLLFGDCTSSLSQKEDSEAVFLVPGLNSLPEVLHQEVMSTLHQLNSLYSLGPSVAPLHRYLSFQEILGVCALPSKDSEFILFSMAIIEKGQYFKGIIIDQHVNACFEKNVIPCLEKLSTEEMCKLKLLHQNFFRGKNSGVELFKKSFVLAFASVQKKDPIHRWNGELSQECNLGLHWDDSGANGMLRLVIEAKDAVWKKLIYDRFTSFRKTFPNKSMYGASKDNSNEEMPTEPETKKQKK